jgi:gliding motility-associated protein GldM
MAGGKETPRQKLIGMMYLVLLALLALQMGQEILLKFQQLNQSLGLFVSESTTKNIGLVAGIQDKVSKNGGKDAYVIDLATKLRKAAAATVSKIDEVKEGLVQETDGWDESQPGLKVPVGMKDKDKSSAFLIGKGDKNDGKAYEIKKSLEDFIIVANEVKSEIGKRSNKKVDLYSGLALDGKEDPLFKNNPEKRTLDFAHLNFDHTEMIASMAFLTERQSRVSAIETELLTSIGELVGLTDFKFDRIDAMYSAKSEVVASGMDYEANLFVTASSSQMKPTMTASAPGGVRMEGNIGKIKFVAPSVSKLTDMSWRGNIKINKPGGTDTTLSVDVKYQVAPLVLDVQAGAVSALYRNCANPLKIMCPALAEKYSPAFGITGGSLEKGSETGAIVVYPASAKGTKVSITVSQNGKGIGTKVFETKAIPMPTVEILTDGRPMPKKTGMTAPGPRGIQVKIKADEGFASALPTESKYAATSWKATLVRGRRPVGSGKSFSSANGDVNSFRDQAKPGDRIVIEVEKVVRRTSKGAMESVDGLGTIVETLSLTE